MSDTVLIAVTNHSRLGDSGKKTGFHLGEAAYPYYEFKKAGYKVHFCSPTGGMAPVDPKSKQTEDKTALRFLEEDGNNVKLKNTLSANDVEPDNYAGIFFVGGHGTMWDFPHSRGLAKVTAALYEKGGVIGAVCHGPAALVNVKLYNGEHLVNGKKVNSFTNEEEQDVKMDDVVPFSLEDRLREKGANFSKGNKFAKHVVVDERLVTGQNPASAQEVAQEMIKQMG